MYGISCSAEALIRVTFRMVNAFIKSHSAAAAPGHVYARTTIFIRSDLSHVLFKNVKASETYSEVPHSVAPIIVTF